MIDGGKRGISEASLGSANVLYLALKQLENQHLVNEGVRQHTFLAIEEPEAHLHPHLQRRIYRNYLEVRGKIKEAQPARNIILTTHSPNIASVAPLKNVVVLRHVVGQSHTDGRSLHDIPLADPEIEDLERYMDATRGELFFSKGVILVEGDSEKYLLPTLARLHAPEFDLDEFGITVCSISGTNFSPYVKLLGPKGLRCPFVILTDFDPINEDVSQEDEDLEEEGQQMSYGAARVVNSIMPHFVPHEEGGISEFEKVLDSAPNHGVFLNNFTFEIDLFINGAHELFAETMKGLTTNRRIHSRFDRLAENPDNLDAKQLLKDINSVGKGRFAQRLSTVLERKDIDICPPYIADALAYLKGKME
jgi:putative ATP-dependent endonuclease of OLD family